MDKMFQNNSGELSEHPPREMLLLFVDGELPAKETAQLETHLEACWPCRVKTKKIQEGIADIIEFDERVLTPRLTPPQGWRNFDRQLRQLAAQSGRQSLASRLFGSLNRFFPVSHFFAIPHPWFKPLARGLAAALALMLVVALVIHFKREPIVSASELLRNVTEAQDAMLRSTAEPVVHQRLRIRRIDQTSGNEASATLEIWNDTKNARVREFTVDGNQTVSFFGNFGKASSPQASRNPVIDDLAQVLSTNHMDPQRPLSAVSYQSWHNTLQHQRDEVTRSKLWGGVDAVTLHTVPAVQVNVGQIADAVFIVRAKDWQPSTLRLNVRAEAANRTYELTEDLSEVLSLAQVDPKIFANETVALAPTPKASPQMSPASAPLAKLNPSVLPLVTSPLATADLEVEALQLLNQVGADLGEQISVKRTQEGTLQVSGIVETEQRKTEILNALAPIRNNPAVRVEIQTVAEAVAKQTNTPNPSPSTRAVEIAGNTMATEPEVRAYFAREGADTDQVVRRFAARMVGLSNQGMDHLWAMKRLLSQFSPEEQRSLTPEARTKWLAMIRAHARSYQQNTQSLRRELQPIFFPGQSTAGASPEGVIADTNELGRAIEQLFELGSSNDRVIRSAFTTSTGGVMTTVIKAPQFWQSLKNAEAQAARIGAVARP